MDKQHRFDSHGGDGTAALHIEPDGTVTRTRRGHPPEVGTLSVTALRNLRDKIAAANLESLAGSYVKCCDRYERVVSVERAGLVHTVAVTEGVAIPRGLQRAIDALQALATE